MHDKLAAHDALRFRIAAALESARLPQPLHLLLETGNDRIEVRHFIRQQLFLAELQAFISTLQIDQCRRQPRHWIAQQRIERSTQPGIDAPLHPQQPA